MYQLSATEAIRLIRIRFDEQNVNSSSYADLDDIDSNEFENSVKELLPDAINAVHGLAPVQLLDGKKLTSSELNGATLTQGVLSFGVKSDFLRLVAFKASDSFVISEAVPEYSAEGRMQLNPYTMGTPDRPRLVMLAGKSKIASGTDSGKTCTDFKYYSVGSSVTTAAGAISRFEYIPRYKKNTSNAYDVAENFVENVIDYTAGLLAMVYKDNALASYFFQKSGMSAPAQSAQPSE